MAAKNYIATADGYADGRVIRQGEAFTHEFRELVREDKKPGEAFGVIKRDKNGEAVTKAAKDPSWVRPANEAAFAAAQAGDNLVQDPNFDEMEDAALQAYAAERGVPFTKSTKRDDLITAIKAAVDYTR